MDDNPFYVRDYSQCVMCWRCIQVCAEDVQYTFALTWGGRGLGSHVATFFDEAMPDTTCVFCGNCVGVCPTGALKGKVELEVVDDGSKIAIGLEPRIAAHCNRQFFRSCGMKPTESSDRPAPTAVSAARSV